MKLFSATAVALSVGAASALAADLPSTKSPPVAPPPVFTWTGLYVGFNYGYAWTASDPISVVSANAFDRSLLLVPPETPWGTASALGATGRANARLNGFFAGGQLGYNWQFTDRFVLGLEADIQGAGVRGGSGLANLTPRGYSTADFAITSATLRRSLEYFGTIRGRAGFAVTPTILVYATGGLAYGGVDESAVIKQSLSQSPVPSTLFADGAKGDVFRNRVGWTVGAGFEWAFAHNLSAKLEYLYYDLGALTLTNANISPLAFKDLVLGDVRLADATAVSTRYNGHVLRAGLNYRFDWSQPAVANSGATPLFASPKFDSAERPAFGDWRMVVMPYMWAFGLNGGVTARNQNIATDITFIDVLTKSSSFPLAFMGRVEARNGPVSFYGDLAWVQLRFSGSTLRLRSPVSDLSLGLSASGRMKLTVAIGEAGGAYELARWVLGGNPNSVTALDAYAGLRYWYVNTDVSLDLIGAASAPSLDLDVAGGRAVAKSGTLQWIDPVIGLRVRHEFAPGEEFQARGDIGGFGVGSKFSWEFYGGYSRDFTFNGLNLTSTIGYRALSVDYSQLNNNRQNGINAILHGPLTGVSLRF